MILSALTPFLLLPFVVADGVHRMKLKKFPAIAHEDHTAVVAQLSQKYGGQIPLGGAGGLGRKLYTDNPFNSDRQRDYGDRYWTQGGQQVTGGYGHRLPLNSTAPSC